MLHALFRSPRLRIFLSCTRIPRLPLRHIRKLNNVYPSSKLHGKSYHKPARRTGHTGPNHGVSCPEPHNREGDLVTRC